ncbi:FAD:protein FMN transferase [Herbaspirillum sp. LeCh32-8]|uniref:FAD:protein FMN transferase n=1 Tax=Herbaspirillum sp. LeCh32-8 TaxID=2821356 RepID=UPI001AE7E76D|nr:FAD:protein FMN transferase [Herbaspirillum sp. LeCh32-8]MBP0600126.1 FAD:protein FMN transferase [Herbaspirillum sp. LeCh32-8]
MSNRVLIPLSMDAPPTLPPGVTEHHLAGAAMGTSWRVHALAPKGVRSDAIEAAVQVQLARVIREMSTWEPDSHLSRFNRATAGSWHALPDAFYTVLDAALAMAVDSDGAFDPSIGPLVNLWGFGPVAEGEDRVRSLPEAAELEQVRARCGWQRLGLDRATRSLLQPGGAYLDFSGIAKGYAVDLVAQALRELACVSWLVEIGGELSGLGVKPDGQPWWVALERPPQDDGEGMLVALHGLAIATSGDYRHYFEQDGRRYAHTIDPRSGRPVAHDLASVTVLHPQCMVADALATVLTVLGEEQGMAFARSRNIAALFICGGADGAAHFRESMTPAMAAMLE